MSRGRNDAGVRAVLPPAFVGRDRELAALRASLTVPPALIVVEGEAGVGKSRLLRELLAARDGVSARALLAVCPPFRVPFTLGPVVDAIREAAGDGVSGLALSGLAGALRSLFPEWADDLPGALEPAEDALAARHRLFRALTELVDRLDVSLLVVDDAHWADDATLEFLLFLTSRRTQDVSLIVAYRPEDVPSDSLLPRLASHSGSEVTRLRLALDPLDVTETGRLVSSMLAGEPISSAFAGLVHRHTEGLPLAVEELVRLMSERTDLTRRGGEWVRRRLDEIHAPPTVRDAVLERTQHLRAETQAILRAAAVVMDGATVATLGAVAELPPERSRAGVVEALGCGLLEENASGLVAFRHTLAGRAVYDAIALPDRQVLHGRAGAVLEDSPRPPVTRLARHFRLAGDRTRWRSYAERAADAAAAAGDWVAAAELVHDLLTDADLPAAAAAPLAAKLPSGSLTGMSRLRNITHALTRALESGVLDARQEAVTRYQLAMALERTDDYEACRRQLELAVPGLAEGSLELLNAMLFLGWALSSSCPGQVHRDWLRRAAAAAGSVPPAEQPDITTKTAIALVLLDEPDGWTLAATLPDEVSTPAQRRNVTHRDYNLGELAMRWGRYPEARSRLGNALALAEAQGYPRYRQGILANLIYLDWFTGDWYGLADRAAALAEAEDTLPMKRHQASLVTGLLLAADGRHADAQSVLEHVLVRLRELGAVEFLVHPAAALTRLHLAAGEPGEALCVSEEPLGIVALKQTWLWAIDLAPARVDALVAAGRGAEGADLVAAFGAGIQGRDAPAAQAALALCEGVVADGRGEHAMAATRFERAAAAWDALPRPYGALLARERLARCLIATGSDESGLALLTTVSEGLSKLGARGDAARAVQALRGHGVDARQPWRGGRRGYGDQLSPRELDVARLIVAGQTNREIAQALFVSPKTVARHVDSAMRKLGVTSRTALAVKAMETGVVTAGSSDAASR